MAQRRKTTIGRNPLDAVRDDQPVPDQGPALSRSAAPHADNPSRGVFEAWAAGTEETLRATFDAQNTALLAGLSLMDAAAASQRGVVEGWRQAAERAQKAALEAFRRSTRAAASANNPTSGPLSG